MGEASGRAQGEVQKGRCGLPFPKEESTKRSGAAIFATGEP